MTDTADATNCENSQPKKYNPRHHAMLAYCLYKGDSFLWNDWRDYYWKKFLKGQKPNAAELIASSHINSTNQWKALFKAIKAITRGYILESDRKARLDFKNLSVARFEGAKILGAHLEGINLDGVRLEGVNLFATHLEGATLHETRLEGATLAVARLEGADLFEVHLEGAKISGARLEGTDLVRSNFRGAQLLMTNLQGANFKEADLQNVWLKESNLHSANFNLARVNGDTSITECKFDRNTDFTGVGLDAATIDPELKAAFKNNIRRIRWQKWAESAPTKWKKWYRKTVNLFWLLSNYGSSTERILGWFFGLAGYFGLLYWLYAIPESGAYSIIEELRLADGNGQPFSIWHTLARALYFSVVTMTTLGFGDMHAAKTGGLPSYLGYLFLSVQVMLGYVMLGALVTRMGILFTSEAPAADPEPDYDPEKDAKNDEEEGFPYGIIFRGEKLPP